MSNTDNGVNGCEAGYCGKVGGKETEYLDTSHIYGENELGEHSGIKLRENKIQ